MELRHLRYFLAVAEERHFTKAAQCLRVAQPSLSRQIRDLEEEVGVPLLVRTRRQVRLTGAGEVFFRQAEEIVAGSQKLVRDARRAQEGEMGRLRIGYVATLSQAFIPRLMRLYRQRYPDVELALVDLPPTEQAEALLKEKIDIGFAGQPVHTYEHLLRHITIRRNPMAAILWPGHPLARKRLLRLEDLHEEGFIFLSRKVAPDFFGWVMGLFRQAGYTPRIINEVEKVLSVLDYVSAGFGVAVLPHIPLRLMTPDIVIRDLSGKLPLFESTMMWKEENPSPTLKNFTTLVRGFLRDEGRDAAV